MSHEYPPLPEPSGWIYDGHPDFLRFSRKAPTGSESLVLSTSLVFESHKLHAYAAPLLERIAELEGAVAAERERWSKAVEFAAHKLEGARIWGGMEWHYNPCPPHQYKPALDLLRDALNS